MGSGTKQRRRKLPQTPCGQLPPQIKILFVCGRGRTGAWLAEAFASDRASEVLLEEAVGVAEGLARLRDEIYDAVLLGHEGDDFDALQILDAIRTGSSEEQPIVVLGPQSEQELSDLCFEAGADDYVCVNTATTRTLIWKLARAIERHRLIAENRRLEQAQRHRLHMEHTEATRLLQQQRGLICDLERLRIDQSESGEAISTQSAAADAMSPVELPEPLVNHYRELLRAYVIMGSGNLAEDMQRLAHMLATAGISATQAMLLHLQVLEEMVRSLGSRSARHVLNRADLLILEVIINLAEDYRQRLIHRLHPPRQQMLRGFE